MNPDARVMTFLATTDPPRALAFYRDVVGLPFVADEPFALIFEARGAALHIQKVAEFAPQPFTALGWQVADIASEVDDLAGRGVVFERYPGMTQDERGVFTFPGGAQVAWFKDPDGNTLSLTQSPPAH